jgi:transmembrane sensor
MNYSQYTVEDFAADRSFQAWVNKADPQACLYWDNWILLNAGKTAMVEEARNIVLHMRFAENLPTARDMEEVREHIQRSLQNNRKAEARGKMLRLYGWTMAAAALAVILAGSWWYAGRMGPAKPGPFLAVTSVGNNSPVPGSKVTWQTKANESHKPVKMTLEDGTVVTLFENTSIKYPAPFTMGKRDILLNGDAFFDVAKDRARPFTVYSRKLAVTALGTSFRITASNEGTGQVTVKLFTGKVQVKSTGNISNWKGDVFLLPGDQLRYNLSGEVVSAFRASKVILSRNTAGSMDVSNGEIRFNRTPLPVVMKALSAFYKMKISYTSTDITTMNFTGVINQADRIDAVLGAIAQMNGLDATQTPEGFSITRSKK